MRSSNQRSIIGFSRSIIFTALSLLATQTACKKSSEEQSAVAIVNGEIAEAGSAVFRSTAMLKFSDGSYCTGTLVGPRQLTTAAHCLKPIEKEGTFKVGFGLDSNLQPALIRQVSKWVIHPSYSTDYDLAVLTLTEDVPAPYQAVQIANPGDIGFFREVIYAGYGSLYEEDESDQPLRWVSTRVLYVSKLFKHFTTFMTNKGSCYGDSGGPGYIFDSQSQSLKAVGAVSTASRLGNGKCGQGDTTTDLTQFHSWIAGSFRAMGAPLPYDLGNDSSESALSRNKIILNH